MKSASVGFLLPSFPPSPAPGTKALAALPHRLAGNLKRQQAAARTTPRLFFFPFDAEDYLIGG